MTTACRELAALLKSGGRAARSRTRVSDQGDQRERIVAELEKLGYKVKRVEVAPRP
jgi:translation initiation factor 1 (eIF-1/SUI1)